MRLNRNPWRTASAVLALLCSAAGLGWAQTSPIPRPSDPPPNPSPNAPWTPSGAADIARAAAQAASQAAGAGGTSTPREAVPLATQTIVALFVDGCITHEAALQPVVDWALNAGLVPQDSQSSGARVLLDGHAGSVFSPPGAEGRVMLAVAEGQHCVLWVDRAAGPSIRLALLQKLGERKARGDRVEPEFDRRIERSGAWRQQTQWRYRRVGGSSDFGIGLVSTLTDGPASQVLRWAPLAPVVGFAPDGVPAR